MALIKTEHLYDFMARVNTDPDTGGGIVGMQVTYIDRITDDTGPTVVMERTGRTEPVDYADLAALMNDDNLASLKAAVDAETAARLS